MEKKALYNLSYGVFMLSTSLPDWNPKCLIVSKEHSTSNRLSAKIPLSLIRSQV